MNELIKPKCFNIRLHLDPHRKVIRHLIGELFSGVSSARKEFLDVCVVDMEVYSAAALVKFSVQSADAGSDHSERSCRDWSRRPKRHLAYATLRSKVDSVLSFSVLKKERRSLRDQGIAPTHSARCKFVRAFLARSANRMRVKRRDVQEATRAAKAWATQPARN